MLLVNLYSTISVMHLASVDRIDMKNVAVYGMLLLGVALTFYGVT